MAFNLTLRHFLLKQQVLDLYRNAIRASRGVISELLSVYQTCSTNYNQLFRTQ
jgi:hypothetical protein